MTSNATYWNILGIILFGLAVYYSYNGETNASMFMTTGVFISTAAGGILNKLDKKLIHEDYKGCADNQLIAIEKKIAEKIDHGFGEHGGSPGEYWYEEYEVVAKEMTRRGLSLTPKPT